MAAYDDGDGPDSSCDEPALQQQIAMLKDVLEKQDERLRRTERMLLFFFGLFMISVSLLASPAARVSPPAPAQWLASGQTSAQYTTTRHHLLAAASDTSDSSDTSAQYSTTSRSRQSPSPASAIGDATARHLLATTPAPTPTNATRNVTLEWATVQAGGTGNRSYPAMVTSGGGEATLFAKLSHAPVQGASIVLAVATTWRSRYATCSEAGADSSCSVSSRCAVVLWPAIVVFTSDDWDVTQPIRLRGLDEGAVDDSLTCDVTLTRVGDSTGDLDYDALLQRVSRAELARKSTPPWKLLVQYGSNGMFTSESGGKAELLASLSAAPPNGTVVSFSVTVDAPTEAVVVQPTDLQFTSDTWDLNTTVTVLGVPDISPDGDIGYNVEFTPQPLSSLGYDRSASVAAADAWSGVVGTSVPMINLDTFKERVGVVLSSESCDQGLKQSNASFCSVRWALCYPDAVLKVCEVPLTFEDLFAVGIGRVHVDVWLENHVASSPVEANHTMAELELRSNASSGNVSALRWGTDDGYWPTTLSVDHAASPAYDVAKAEVSDPNDQYEWRGAYGSRLTLRGREDGIVRGDQNVTIRIGAYLHEANTDRFPKTKGLYLPISKYFVASELPESVGGTGTSGSVIYDNADFFNVTMREVDSASFSVAGCSACETTEAGAECEMRLKLNAIPGAPVNFTVNVLPTNDGLVTADRFEGELRGPQRCIGRNSDGFCTQKEYRIDPMHWDNGITIVIKGMDDTVYEVPKYGGRRVPYALDFSNFVSDDPAFANLTDDLQWGFNCTARNEDDESGGFVITQGGSLPPLKVVTSVDENGAFGALHVMLGRPPEADVFVPIWVKHGPVNITSSWLSPCPSHLTNTSAVPVNTRCLHFDLDNYGVAQGVLYRGLDDGGGDGVVDAGGATPFYVEFGPR